MTPDEKIARLEELERRERKGQRNAARMAWTSVALAAVTLGTLIAASYYQLSAIRGEIAELRREQKRLEALNEQKKRLLWEIDVPAPPPESADDAGEPRSGAPRARMPAPKSMPARIYMHITERSDRAFADRAGQALSGGDLVVVGTEYIPNVDNLRRTQVRYYKKSDADTAEQIAAALRGAGAIGAQTVYLKRYENSDAARAKVFEVWFPPEVGGARTSAR